MLRLPFVGLRFLVPPRDGDMQDISNDLKVLVLVHCDALTRAFLPLLDDVVASIVR